MHEAFWTPFSGAYRHEIPRVPFARQGPAGGAPGRGGFRHGFRRRAAAFLSDGRRQGLADNGVENEVEAECPAAARRSVVGSRRATVSPVLSGRRDRGPRLRQLERSLFEPVNNHPSLNRHFFPSHKSPLAGRTFPLLGQVRPGAPRRPRGAGEEGNPPRFAVRPARTQVAPCLVRNTCSGY